ncbi:hypothetical protein Tco_1563166 [Tanacetum coccineum]
MKLSTGRLVNGLSCDGIDMVIKDLDLEPNVDAMMRDFLEQVLKTIPCFRERFSLMLLEHQDIIVEFSGPSHWKKLRKKTSSKILSCGDGSCWKSFKPDGVGSKRYHIVPYGELNGIPVAFVARLGVISKGTDRIRVSHGG